jgi:chemotaxis protein histidine kinase CheA
MKETASEATEMTEKLVKEEIDAKKTKTETETEEAEADEANSKAEEEEADAQLEEENVQVEIDEKEEKIEKTEDALEKTDLQEKLDDAKERKKTIIIRRSKCYLVRQAAWKRYYDAKKKAAAAKALELRIKNAKMWAERARLNAEKALKAKSARLAAKMRQQKIREKIQAQRRKNITKLASELKAKTESNNEEAEDIWEAAKEVVQKVKDYNASLKTNGNGYTTEYVGCFRDRRQRDLPKLFNNYKPTKRGDCLAEAKKKNFKYIGHQYGGECWMSNTFGRYGQTPDTDCKMKCRLENNLICGGGWRNSVWSVKQYIPEERRITEIKEVNESVKGIIGDINKARNNVMHAHRLAKQLSWITGGDLRYL